MMKIKYIFLCLIMIMTSTVKIYALENEKKFVFDGYVSGGGCCGASVR